MLIEYFDCLRCSAVTRVTTCPPKCAACGSGTGVIAKSPDGAVCQRAKKTPPPAGRLTKTLLEALQQQSRLPARTSTPPPGDQEKHA